MMDETRLREILPDVFTWHWFSERHGYDFNGYLFHHPSGNIAVDPVEIPDPVLDELARIGVARIAITNRNHTRDSRRLRERSAARVAIQTMCRFCSSAGRLDWPTARRSR